MALHSPATCCLAHPGFADVHRHTSRARTKRRCGRKRLQLRGQETGRLPNNNERRGKNWHVRTKEILKGYLAFVNVGTFIQSVQIRDHKRTRPDGYMRDHDSLRERGIEFGFFEGNC